MSESNVTLTLEVNEDFVAKLAEAIALANLRAGGLLPHTDVPSSAPGASQPLEEAPQSASVSDPWADEVSQVLATPASAPQDPWSAAPAATFRSPAEDPFSGTKSEPADPWAADGLADLIRKAPDASTLTALWRANKDNWTDEYTNMADARKKELGK